MLTQISQLQHVLGCKVGYLLTMPQHLLLLLLIALQQSYMKFLHAEYVVTQMRLHVCLH